jgi:hypothetical protein
MFVRTKWFDAITAVQISDPVELEGVFRFGVELSWTGAPDGFEGKLQGSIAGVAWRDLMNWGGPLAGGFNDAYTQNSSCHPIRFLRLRLDSLTGGTSPTVTVSVVGVKVRSMVTAWDA